VPLSPQAICRAASTPGALDLEARRQLDLLDQRSQLRFRRTGRRTGRRRKALLSFGLVAEQPVIRWMGPEFFVAGFVFLQLPGSLLRIANARPETKPIVASARTDRWKTDFIASLPWCSDIAALDSSSWTSREPIFSSQYPVASKARLEPPYHSDIATAEREACQSDACQTIIMQLQLGRYREPDYLRAAQAYMSISMPTDTSTIFGVFQVICGFQFLGTMAAGTTGRNVASGAPRAPRLAKVIHREQSDLLGERYASKFPNRGLGFVVGFIRAAIVGSQSQRYLKVRWYWCLPEAVLVKNR